MGKRNQVNPYAKREEELANALLNAGKLDNDIEVKINNDEISTDTVTEVKTDPVVAEIKKEEPKPVEPKVEEPAPVKLEKPSEQQDLFIIKKKIKVKKGQKNLTLKEENIEQLTNFARKYGFNENEVVDYLIENYLKLIKIK